ncbi:MAG: RNA-binding protein [Beijerinckiaceae bacterium]
MRVEDDEKGPMRTCVATRTVRPVGELLRFVVGPDGVLTPDIKGKLPGRGVWVTCSRPVLDDAIGGKAFARSLKQPVETPPDLVDMVDRLLSADARQFLSIANKAGLVIAGFAKVEAALAGGKVRAVVSASDASEDGRRKLRQAARRHAGTRQPPPVATVLAGREMDLALGRENAIHAALLAGAASDAFLARCARLEQFRTGGPRGMRPDAEEISASTGPFALEND